MKAHEDPDALEVIAGIFSLYDIKIYALIDLGSTHSYVCIKHLFDKMPSVEKLEFDMHVTNPLGHSINVNRVYKNCPIMIHDRKFSADLIAFPFREYDLILGMDWLSKHQAIVDCDKKSVALKCPDQSTVTVQGIRFGLLSNVISTRQAHRFLRKGCEAFLALVLDTGTNKTRKYLGGKRIFGYVTVSDMSIAILSGMSPISRAPYRMAPTELKELKTILKELLDKGFVQPSVSP